MTTSIDLTREFRSRLPGWVRAQLHDTHRVTACIHRALTEQGWSMDQLVAECTRDLSGYRNAGGLLTHRLEHCATTPHTTPGKATARPFCSPECADRRGQLEDPKTGLPIGWCECRKGSQ